MTTRVKSQQQMPPLSFIRGKQIDAVYSESPIPEYQGNPLIEALPPLWTMEEVEQMLSYFPDYDPQQKKLPDEIRLHLLENSREFFIPQGVHFEIHLSISNMLRRGYIDRNPAARGAWANRVGKINQLGQKLQRRAFLRSKARGLSIVGVGGVGKSTAVENILSLYPQVITHTHYKGQDLISRQLVWVKLQCPSDGSMRALCMSYLQEVDDILGTNYMKFYGVKRSNVDELLLVMARVASNHLQGVIVFDEIQDLSEAKSGGATRMLNFFVQLENVLGIPFILIGTPKAIELLSGEFRQARRVSEQGDIYWRPMRAIGEKEGQDDSDVPDPDWDVFIRAMWRYWYLRNDHALPANVLNDKVVQTLYEESQGITALVVTIFFLAQRRAITSRVEDLTTKVIRSAVKDNQHFVNKIFERLQVYQPGKRSPRAISDIDNKAWKWPKVELPQKGSTEGNKPLAEENVLPVATAKLTDNRTSPTQRRNRRKASTLSDTLEKGDFRSIDLTTSHEGFGSTDEFS